MNDAGNGERRSLLTFGHQVRQQRHPAGRSGRARRIDRHPQWVIGTLDLGPRTSELVFSYMSMGGHRMQPGEDLQRSFPPGFDKGRDLGRDGLGGSEHPAHGRVFDNHHVSTIDDRGIP
jgi:hypothetical protein